jgi:hypothetical protein
VRFFGVFQARFPIVRGPARFWDKKSINGIMVAFVILHIMILEEDKDLELKFIYNNVGTRDNLQETWTKMQAYFEAYQKI